MPVDHIVRSLKAPREHHIARREAIAKRVTGRQETPSKLELEAEEGKLLVYGVNVSDRATDYITCLAIAEGRGEGLYLSPHLIWVLPFLAITHRA